MRVEIKKETTAKKKRQDRVHHCKGYDVATAEKLERNTGGKQTARVDAKQARMYDTESKESLRGKRRLWA